MAAITKWDVTRFTCWYCRNEEAQEDSITSWAMQDCRISPAYALIPPHVWTRIIHHVQAVSAGRLQAGFYSALSRPI